MPDPAPLPATRVVPAADGVVLEGPGQVQGVQGTLALALPIDPDPPAGHPPTGTRPEPGAGHVADLPDPRAWATAFVQAAMEVSAGLRPPGQLVRWTTPDVHALLVRRWTLTLRARQPTAAAPQLRVLQGGAPRAGVYETAAVVSQAGRVRAVALRMEGMHGRWRVTALEIG